MNKTALGNGRRWGAIAFLRLASAIMRGATKLYQRRTITAAELHAITVFVQFPSWQVLLETLRFKISLALPP